MSEGPNIVVIGAGIAGMSAALTAREAGASVTVLERAPFDERGGNTRFSNAAMRAVYGGVEDITKLVPNLGDGERARTDFGRYTREEYLDDMARVTHDRTDPDLAELLVDHSAETLRWLKANGVKFLPLYDWHPKLPDGTIKFSGGSAVEAWGAGEGIVQTLFDAAQKRGIAISYGTRALSLIENESGVCGVEVREGRRRRTIPCDAAVLACGGFEANAEWRTRYLGPGWELAKVRGSRFNIGDGLRMALKIGRRVCCVWASRR